MHASFLTACSNYNPKPEHSTKMVTTVEIKFSLKFLCLNIIYLRQENI